ncbi:MAG TPA: Crp/Fnr family transcriptional regulator [Candidatus Wallbacteria bacterium]|nr:Crp/Fnr family transcriptional regulator [Candidatus Wallbacteria bacterium]
MKTLKIQEREICQVLSESNIFSGINPPELINFSKIITVKSYEKGETIFSEGDRANGFYIVKSGKVKIYKISSGGKAQIIHIFGPGEPFGEAAIFMENTFPAHAETISGSELIYIKFDDFTNYMKKEPRFALNIIASLCIRLRGFLKTIEELSLNEVSTRLAKYLVSLAERTYKEPENDCVLTLNIKKSLLASQLGTIPETLSRTLAKFKKKGIIKASKNDITITNLEKLLEMADF